MIDDMALLKRTMQQMDAEDPTVAQAAKDQAAQILSDAKLNFAKMAELIEQRRLLLPPAIQNRIKKMDQPGMLGDGAFQDTASALRREGLSFLQIAEAIEASDRPAPVARSNAPAPGQESEPFHATDDQPEAPALLRALFFVGRIFLFPVRHPLRSLAIGLVALILLYGVRGAVVLSEWASGYSRGSAAVHRLDTAISSVRSFLHERISPQAKEPQTSDTPTASPTAVATAQPSASPAAPAAGPPSSTASSGPTASAQATPVPGPTTSQSAAVAPPQIAPAPSQAAPAGPQMSTPRRDAGDVPSKFGTNSGAARDDRYASRRGAPYGAPYEDNRRRVFQDATPEWLRRNSRRTTPCSAGVGGCYWGGGQF
jgi:hypothetical protein